MYGDGELALRRAGPIRIDHRICDRGLARFIRRKGHAGEAAGKPRSKKDISHGGQPRESMASHHLRTSVFGLTAFHTDPDVARTDSRNHATDMSSNEIRASIILSKLRLAIVGYLVRAVNKHLASEPLQSLLERIVACIAAVLESA